MKSLQIPNVVLGLLRQANCLISQNKGKVISHRLLRTVWSLGGSCEYEETNKASKVYIYNPNYSCRNVSWSWNKYSHRKRSSYLKSFWRADLCFKGQFKASNVQVNPRGTKVLSHSRLIHSLQNTVWNLQKLLLFLGKEEKQIMFNWPPGPRGT